MRLPGDGPIGGVIDKLQELFLRDVLPALRSGALDLGDCPSVVIQVNPSERREGCETIYLTLTASREMMG